MHRNRCAASRPHLGGALRYELPPDVAETYARVDRAPPREHVAGPDGRLLTDDTVILEHGVRADARARREDASGDPCAGRRR